MKFFFDDFGSDFNQIRNWIVYSGRSILWVLDLVMEFSIEEFLESLYLKENSFFLYTIIRYGKMRDITRRHEDGVIDGNIMTENFGIMRNNSEFRKNSGKIG